MSLKPITVWVTDFPKIKLQLILTSFYIKKAKRFKIFGIRSGERTMTSMFLNSKQIKMIETSNNGTMQNFRITQAGNRSERGL